MAFTKNEKEQLLDQYAQWVDQGHGIFAVSYSKMSVKDINILRAKAREVGGELHVAKNTLMTRVLRERGYSDTNILEGTTLVAVAFNDPAALAKVLSDSTVKSDIFAIKGGFLDGRALKEAQVKALAELPPLPVMRARLLGVFSAPASQLVRTLAEPARGLAAVVKAFSEKEAAPVAG